LRGIGPKQKSRANQQNSNPNSGKKQRWFAHSGSDILQDGDPTEGTKSTQAMLPNPRSPPAP
jgi:hypothetical protein